MKKLHTFKVSIPQEVEKTDTVTREGQQIKETRKVTENVDYTFVLKQLSRSETDSARLFNGASLKRAIDAGLITNAVLVQKHIDGNGSLISKDTAKRIISLNEEIQSIKDQIISLGLTKDDSEKQEIQTKLLVRFEEATRELRAIEGSNQAVFGSTAEKYANERSNLWIMLNQTYIEKGGKPEPYFKGKDFDEKEKFLEGLEENNDILYFAAAEKISTYWGYYLSGLVTNEEQFKALDEELLKSEQEKKEEGVKVDETVTEPATT